MNFVTVTHFDYFVFNLSYSVVLLCFVAFQTRVLSVWIKFGDDNFVEQLILFFYEKEKVSPQLVV